MKSPDPGLKGFQGLSKGVNPGYPKFGVPQIRSTPNPGSLISCVIILEVTDFGGYGS